MVSPYDHTPIRPVIRRIKVTYHRRVVTVHAQLGISSGKARLRPSYPVVFCLTARPDISGSGTKHVVSRMVADEVKRLGWGWARGVRW